MIRVSSGTAAVLGLSIARGMDDPTTAYLMVGDRCRRDCAFCAQARASLASLDSLSRVAWPDFPGEAVIQALREARSQGLVRRCCLQVTDSEGSFDRAVALADRIGSWLPLSASVHVEGLKDVGRLIEAGAQTVGLSLDAANPEAFARSRGGGWDRAMTLIERAASAHPGRIACHLIVGLGESEREMVAMIGELLSWGVTVGLFAFTPTPGTPMAEHSPPSFGTYRRVQVAHYLMRRGLCAFESFEFSTDGRLMGFGLALPELREALADGEAFRTSGCPGCNRPYYNERPGGPLYNYPRPLAGGEAAEAIREALE